MKADGGFLNGDVPFPLSCLWLRLLRFVQNAPKSAEQPKVWTVRLAASKWRSPPNRNNRGTEWRLWGLSLHLNIIILRRATGLRTKYQQFVLIFVSTCLFVTLRQYREALESYKNMSQQMKNFHSFIRCLDNVMSHRLQAYADLRK